MYTRTGDTIIFITASDYKGGGGGINYLVIGEWPVLFLVKCELAIFKNVYCE